MSVNLSNARIKSNSGYSRSILQFQTYNISIIIQLTLDTLEGRISL